MIRIHAPTTPHFGSFPRACPYGSKRARNRASFLMLEMVNGAW